MANRFTSALVPLSIQGDDTSEIALRAAEFVRPRHKLEAEDMFAFDVTVDGFIHHDRPLKIATPSGPGRFITGRVADPVIWNAPNICTETATEWMWPKVTARPAMQDGQLNSPCILDARKIDAPSGVAG